MSRVYMIMQNVIDINKENEYLPTTLRSLEQFQSQTTAMRFFCSAHAATADRRWSICHSFCDETRSTKLLSAFRNLIPTMVWQSSPSPTLK